MTKHCGVAVQAFAAAGHASSGSLGVMGSGPLGSGAMQPQQQGPDAGRPFMQSPGPHAAAFGQPGQQHGGHAFFNQVRPCGQASSCLCQ